MSRPRCPAPTKWVLLLGCLLATLGSFRLAQAQDSDEKAKAKATRKYAVALGFQKKKLYAQAAERWRKFIKEYPKHKRIANAHYHLGVCEFQQKEFDKAEKTFRTTLKKFNEFEHRDGVQFNLGLVLYNVALASQKAEDYEKAASAFAAVAEKFGQSEHTPAALYYQAECLYAAENPEAAVPVYQRVIQNHAKSRLLPDVYYALGTTQQELAQYAEAAETFQTFLQKFSDHDRALECRLRLGMALYNQEQYDQAENHFEQAAKADDFAYADFALLQQARSLAEQDEPEQAAKLFESLPKRFEESQYIHAALLAGGKSRFRAEDFSQAQKDLAAVVEDEESPQAPEAAYWLGRTLLATEKPAEAVSVLEEAIDKYSDSEMLPELAFSRIDALYEQEDQRAATVDLYAEFARKYPEHNRAAEAQYRASLAAFQLGDYPVAAEHAATFLDNQRFAESEFTPEVLFLGAESHLLAEEANPQKAIPLYQKLIAEYPEHEHVPRARVRVGFSRYLQENYDQAVPALKKAAQSVEEPALLAEARLLLGRSHRQSDRLDQAISAFRAALKAKSDWQRADEVLFVLGLSLYATENLQEAASSLKKLVGQFDESPYRDRASYQLGEIAFDQEEFDQAVDNYRQVVSQFPESELAPTAQYSIGSALFQKGNYENAAEALSKLLDEYSEAEIVADGRYLRGTCYQRLEQFDSAIEDLNQFLQTDPAEEDALDARFALGLCQVGAEDYAGAIQTLSSLVQSKPDYTDADQAYYELAFAYLETDKPQQAAATFRKLATKLPESPLVAESWFRVGEFHEQAEEMPKAAEAYAAGLEKAEQPELHERLGYKLGWVQYQQESYEQATKTFQATLEAHPEGDLVPDVTYLAGECLFQQDQFKPARPYFAKVIDAKAEDYHDRALYRAGRCAVKLEQWSDGAKHFRALLKQFPEFEQVNEARYGLGFALQNQKEFDQAKQVYKQVTEATNTETAAKSQFMMGECAFGQEEYEEAIEHFLEAALGYPYKEWQALGHFEAGRCFIELGDTEKARDALQTVVQKFPDHQRADDAKNLLANLEESAAGG